MNNLLIGQMHTKDWPVEAFIIEFAAVLQKELPIVLNSTILKRFSVELIHNLNADPIHRPTKMLHDMEAIQDDSGIGKEFLGNVVIGAEHVHGNDLGSFPDLSV